MKFTAKKSYIFFFSNKLHTKELKVGALIPQLKNEPIKTSLCLFLIHLQYIHFWGFTFY